MRDFFDETPLMQSGQSLPLFHFGQGSINLTQLTFGYEGKQVLQDFDLSLEAGKIYALVGPSGGGKSTIMKLIA
jgi:ABC-type multidrug transport system fused ATPase/permease subunit